MNNLEKLALYCYNLKLLDVPGNVIDETKMAIIDSLGATIGASYYEEIPSIVKEYSKFSGTKFQKGASIWGYEDQFSISDAVFLNGVMSHALELDDVHTGSKTHIGAIVVPTAWTVANCIGATGEQLLEAVICGYEVMSRVGKGFGVESHRLKGWHVTGTAGTFGAAAVCAKLFKLDFKQTVSALAMAGTQSSGLWAFLEDGASCKKLHTARASVSGLTAAMLAKSNMTGPQNILIADDGGLYKATSDNYNIEAVSEKLGERYEILYRDVKPYPCCRSSHCVIEATLNIKQKNNINIDKIDNILIESYEIGVKQCGAKLYPQKPSDAKFSYKFVVAAALLNGKVTLEEFEQKFINKEEVKSIANKVTSKCCEEVTKKYPEHWGCILTMTMKDGTVYKDTIIDSSGSVYKPLTKAQNIIKFKSLVKPILGKEKVERLLENIFDLEKVNKIIFY